MRSCNTISIIMLQLFESELHLYQTKTTMIEEKIMADNEQKVIDAMKKAGEPLSSGDIAERTGIEKKEVGKIINALVTRTRAQPLASIPAARTASPALARLAAEAARSAT